AVLRVRDTGQGISPEAQLHIFDMYTQGEGPQERRSDGLGIGLALVKKLVDLHEGTIEARSEGVGRGSEFIVRIPLAPSDAIVASDNVAANSAAPTRSLRVLVVDDNPDAADSLMFAFAGVGHEARTAY